MYKTYLAGVLTGALVVAAVVTGPFGRGWTPNAFAGDVVAQTRPAPVVGVGGVFFRATDPAGLREWYIEHLGLEPAPQGHVAFMWRQLADPTQAGFTVWSLFPDATEYFGPAGKQFMINYIVADLEATLERLDRAGVSAIRREEQPFGKFAWVEDPEGNRLELWEMTPAPVEAFEEP
jgi:catechol 2,3-dioxygenase-like lactoylglutathione lyase family enzyme